MPRKLLQSKALTPYELVTLLLSISGLISLFFIAQQVRTANEQALTAKIQTQALTTQSVMDQLLRLDDLFISHPELRPYFYKRKEIIEGDGNYDKALAVAEFQLDFFDSYLTQAEYLSLKPEERQNWETYIADSFSNSPIMCVRLKGAPGWYSAKLEELAKCP
jgi:hypothetical protein